MRAKAPCCLACWFAAAAQKVTGAGADGPALRDLFVAQGGRCAYTGEQLTPGVNAVAVRKVPRARGGCRTIGNTVWAAARIARAKTRMTDEDFAARYRCDAAPGGGEG